MGKLAKTVEFGKSTSKIEAIKEWLKENYIIKLNQFDHDKSYIKPTESNPIEYKYSISVNDIYLHMIDDDIKGSRTLLKSILMSPNQSEVYNPILEYFDSLKGSYKGLSEIDKLCACLKAHEFGIDKGIYQARLCYIIKKWLVASVACVKGIRQNDVALGLVNARGGIGKTTFFEDLVPISLKEYYQISSKDDRFFKMTEDFSKKFIINFDEFVGITKSTENEFKNDMSRKTIDVKRQGDIFSKRVTRIANCCFTSNKTHEQGGFLYTNDDGLMRRLATIEIDDMDIFSNPIDVNQLWAEALMMYEGGFDYEWMPKDFKDFSTYNQRYIIETNALKLIKEYYRVPDKNEECKYVMPMQIIRDLREKHLIKSGWTKIDEITIGQALSLLGFYRHMKKIDNKPRYVYDVIQLY